MGSSFASLHDGGMLLRTDPAPIAHRPTVPTGADVCRPAQRPSQRWRVGAATSARPGARVGRNEDSLLIGPVCCAVADGMGGHAAGDVASRIVTDTLAVLGADVEPNVIQRLIDRADSEIRRWATATAVSSMGSTVVGVVQVDQGEGPGTAVFHVGDSRCYRLAAGELRLVTADHSHVQELVDAGVVPRQLAMSHPLRHVITRSIGAGERHDADLVMLDPSPCRLLLCSDGVSGPLMPRAIGRTLTGVSDPQAAADRLVQLAVEGGSTDDASAIVIDIS